MIASAAFQAGQLVGYLILLLVLIGLVRTFTRSDLTMREKILGKRKRG